MRWSTFHYFDQIAVAQETAATGDQLVLGCNAALDLDLVADNAPGLHLDLGHAAVGANTRNVAEAVANDDRGLRHRQPARTPQLKLATRVHAGLETGPHACHCPGIG